MRATTAFGWPSSQTGCGEDLQQTMTTSCVLPTSPFPSFPPGRFFEFVQARRLGVEAQGCVGGGLAASFGGVGVAHHGGLPTHQLLSVSVSRRRRAPYPVSPAGDPAKPGWSPPL